jgi:hypothetical protein
MGGLSLVKTRFIIFYDWLYRVSSVSLSEHLTGSAGTSKDTVPYTVSTFAYPITKKGIRQWDCESVEFGAKYSSRP